MVASLGLPFNAWIMRGTHLCVWDCLEELCRLPRMCMFNPPFWDIKPKNWVFRRGVKKKGIDLPSWLALCSSFFWRIDGCIPPLLCVCQPSPHCMKGLEWDLLEALFQGAFQPLLADLFDITFNRVLLLALTLTITMSDLHPLPVHPNGIMIRGYLWQTPHSKSILHAWEH